MQKKKKTKQKPQTHLAKMSTISKDNWIFFQNFQETFYILFQEIICFIFLHFYQGTSSSHDL